MGDDAEVALLHGDGAVVVDVEQRVPEGHQARVFHGAGAEIRNGDDVEFFVGVADAEGPFLVDHDSGGALQAGGEQGTFAPGRQTANR